MRRVLTRKAASAPAGGTLQVTPSFSGLLSVLDTQDSAVTSGSSASGGATTGEQAIGYSYIDPDTGYTASQMFLAFDTSNIAVGNTATTATLELAGGTNLGLTTAAGSVEVYAFDWTANGTSALEGGDWRNPTWLQGATRVASKSFNGSLASDWPTSTTTRFALTSDAAFLSAIVKGGTTRLVLVVSNQRIGTVNTSNGQIVPYQASGPGQPRLTVVYS